MRRSPITLTMMLDAAARYFDVSRYSARECRLMSASL